MPLYGDLKARSKGGNKRLQFQDRWASDVWYDPDHVSDGSVLAAAFVALAYQRDAPDLIVIEDPDHGLHPYLQRQVVQQLRAVSTGAIGPKPIQVVCTTHSKTLVDCLEPEEVRFLSRDSDTGETLVRSAPTDNPRWQELYDDFQEALGDIWLTGAVGGVAMSLRVIVHCEGPGDAGNPAAWIEAGGPLLEDDLGPAHDLVRRLLETDRRLPPAAVDFRAPFQSATGPVTGSNLLDQKKLAQALAPWWLEESDVRIVVLVDADGLDAADRRKSSAEVVARVSLVGAVGVAVQEFESWLLTDANALQAVLGPNASSVSSVESLTPGAAKRHLAALTRANAANSRARLLRRREIAGRSDLDVLSARSSSFRKFREELAVGLPR